MDTQIKHTTPLITVQKKNYVGINLAKQVQAYMMKEIKEDLNKPRDISCLWLDNTVKNLINIQGKGKFSKYFKLNENGNTTYQNV